MLTKTHTICIHRSKKPVSKPQKTILIYTPETEPLEQNGSTSSFRFYVRFLGSFFSTTPKYQFNHFFPTQNWRSNPLKASASNFQKKWPSLPWTPFPTKPGFVQRPDSNLQFPLRVPPPLEHLPWQILTFSCPKKIWWPKTGNAISTLWFWGFWCSLARSFSRGKYIIPGSLAPPNIIDREDIERGGASNWSELSKCWCI